MLAFFKECLRQNEFAIAINLWKLYDFALTTKKNQQTVIRACVDAFVKSPDLLESKIYLIMQLLTSMGYEHIDRILSSMEERFGEIAEDGANSYLLCNLSPIKTACHMLNLLS